MCDPILVTATGSLDLNFTTFCYIKKYITFFIILLLIFLRLGISRLDFISSLASLRNDCTCARKPTYYCLNAVADISFSYFFFSVYCFNQLIDVTSSFLVSGINRRKSWRSVLLWFGNKPFIVLLHANCLILSYKQRLVLAVIQLSLDVTEETPAVVKLTSKLASSKVQSFGSSRLFSFWFYFIVAVLLMHLRFK